MKFRKEMRESRTEQNMWVHIIIFVLTFGTVLVWKAGWIRLDGIADRQSMRLFLLVAVCGNLLGMALTMTDGKDVVYQEGHRMEKNPDGAYTEELEVSVDGRKPQKFDVEIPEKETEETEVEPEQEVNEAEQRQKELKEIPAEKIYPELEYESPKVLFVNYDMVQTMIYLLSKDVKFDKWVHSHTRPSFQQRSVLRKE